MAKRPNGWIEVYPFNGREVEVINSGARASLRKELSDYADRLWKPKAEKGWKSSWVALANKVNFGDGKIIVHAGAMPFYQADAMDTGTEEGNEFAPKNGYLNCLSVGFPTATKDGKVIFQRRGPNVHCPNTLIHEPCGYMTSLSFVNRAECDKPEYADDRRLFDLKTQLDFRKKEIADKFGIAEDKVEYDLTQDFLATGWLAIELYFSCSGRINAEQRELKIPEKEEIFFVPFEDLKKLIYNQGRLSQVNPIGYRPEDPTEIPLIDESLLGLMYGYEKLTGDRLDLNETIDRLNRDGLDIKVYDTSPGKSYNFPIEF